MPRLSDRDYLLNYDTLRNEFLHGSQALRFLEPHEQWVLFDFYQHYEQLTPAELLDHRRKVSQRSPPLPQRAGKAFRHWQQVCDMQAQRRKEQPPVQAKRRPSSRNVSLAFQVRPEPDVKQLARAFILLAKHLNQKQRAVNVEPKSELQGEVDDGQHEQSDA